MSLVQSDRIVDRRGWQATPFYRGLGGKLFAQSVLVVLVCGYFVFWGYVVTHGSVDQAWQAISEAITSTGL
jgi:hypothetical protein